MPNNNDDIIERIMKPDYYLLHRTNTLNLSLIPMLHIQCVFRFPMIVLDRETEESKWNNYLKNQNGLLWYSNEIPRQAELWLGDGLHNQFMCSRLTKKIAPNWISKVISKESSLQQEFGYHRPEWNEQKTSDKTAASACSLDLTMALNQFSTSIYSPEALCVCLGTYFSLLFFSVFVLNLGLKE